LAPFAASRNRFCSRPSQTQFSLGDLARHSSEHDGQAPYADDLPQIVLDEVHHLGWHLINGQDSLDERAVAPGLNPIEHQIPSREGSQQTGKQSWVGIGGKLELNRLKRDQNKYYLDVISPMSRPITSELPNGPLDTLYVFVATFILWIFVR
jgi:hypothetical protein